MSEKILWKYSRFSGFLQSFMLMFGIYGTWKYHRASLDYIQGSKRVKNVSRNMWMLPKGILLHAAIGQVHKQHNSETDWQAETSC